MTRPHIVFIMADHLRRDCISCYGDVAVRTPNLDELARESVVFDGAYCAAPLCTPTRSSMYTGKWPHTHGAIVNGHGFRPGGIVSPGHGTLYEALDRAGYSITQMGVQHLQTEPKLEQRVPRARILGRMGYDEYARDRNIRCSPDVEAQAVPNVEFRDGRPVVAHRPQARKTLFPHPADDYLDVYWSRRMAAEIAALDPAETQYIEALFWAPHPPLDVPEPYYSMYPEGDIDLPDTVGRWQPGQPATLLFQSCGMMGLGRTREEYREGWSAYMGLVTMVDECIGRVVQALKDRGIWDEALVVFVQDHGDLMGCHHLTQKHCFYEEAAHLPMLVKPPRSAGVAPGRRGGLVSAIDYCPTVCDYAGAEPPEGVQGASWRRLVDDADAPWRDAVFMEYSGDQGRNDMPMRAIVAEADGAVWKYTYTHNDVDELYNLTTDPMEKDSLAQSEGDRPVLLELRRRLAAWMRDTGDFVGMPPRPSGRVGPSEKPGLRREPPAGTS
ncbi:MAG: sulfatase family protein [Planctomycetota bacterium]|jgi:arylsulfatase A-like enzyme